MSTISVVAETMFRRLNAGEPVDLPMLADGLGRVEVMSAEDAADLCRVGLYMLGEGVNAFDVFARLGTWLDWRAGRGDDWYRDQEAQEVRAAWRVIEGDGVPGEDA